MTEERRLLAAGMPLEDAISTCQALRREGSLEEFAARKENRHICKCGGSGKCADCPNRNK